MRRLLVIAEAARRVSEATRQMPNVSWQEINGIRNQLAYEYDDVNLNIVWDVVQSEKSPLIKELKLHIPPEH